jgi:hypothetical protein
MGGGKARAMMDADGFSSPKERKFFEDLAHKFVERADEAKRKGYRRNHLLTEQVIWNGYHEISRTLFDIHNCGGWKGIDDLNIHDVSIKLRKMVTGK